MCEENGNPSTRAGEENLPWSGEWCEGAPVERTGQREGHCTACGRALVAKKDGAARRHRPFR